MNGEFFDNSEQASTFLKVVKALKKGGATKVGLSGSRAVGQQNQKGKISDIDIPVIFPRAHPQTSLAEDILLKRLPDGTRIPDNVQVISVPEGEGSHVANSLKKKARWLKLK